MTTAHSVREMLLPEFQDLPSVPVDQLDERHLPSLRVPQAGLGTTDRVQRVEHRIPGQPDITVRVHRPIGVTDALPAILAIHGGGFIMGSPDSDDVRFEAWCPSIGVVGVSVEYRLAPETPYPGAVDDCYGALAWMHENAHELGIDARRIGIWGRSAGGGLAAAVTLLTRDRGRLPLAFQVLESPMLDDRRQTSSSNLDGLPIWSREANEFGWRCYLGELVGRDDVPIYAAPARADDLAGLPPAFVSVGGVDGFRDEDVAYALRLSQAGVATELHVYPGAPHGYQMFADSPVAAQNLRDLTDWLSRIVR